MYFFIFIIPLVIYFLALFTRIVNISQLGVFNVIIVFGLGLPAYYFFHEAKISSSGVQGEENTLELLSALPEGYQVFHNVNVTFGDYSNKLDVVIVGENGLFVVEVKNHNGRIVGNVEDQQWRQHKIGRKGNPYSSEMRNPIKQVKGQTMTLSKNFKMMKLNVWIQGIVFFSNSEVILELRGNSDIPVFSGEELKRYITRFSPKEKMAIESIKRISEWLQLQQVSSQ
jgi:hypothetical protein